MRLVTSILLVSSAPCAGLELRKSDSLRAGAGFLRGAPDDQEDQQQIAALKAQVASLKLEQDEWKAGPDGKAEQKMSEQLKEDEAQKKTLQEELVNEETALVKSQQELQERTAELDVRDQEVTTLEAEVSNLSVAHNSSNALEDSSDNSSDAPATDSNFSRNLSMTVSDSATNATAGTRRSPKFTTHQTAPYGKAPAPPAENVTLVAEVATLQATLSEVRVEAAIEKEKNRNLRQIQKALWDKTTKLFSKVNASLRKSLQQLGEEKIKNQEMREQGLQLFNESKQLGAENARLKKLAGSLQDDKSQMILTMRGVLAQNIQYEREDQDFKQKIQAQAQDFHKREDMYKKKIAEYQDTTDKFFSKERPVKHASMVVATTSAAPAAHRPADKASSPAEAKVVTPAPASAQQVVAAAKQKEQEEAEAVEKKARNLQEEVNNEDKAEEVVPDMEDLSDLSKLEVGIDKAKSELDLDS